MHYSVAAVPALLFAVATFGLGSAEVAAEIENSPAQAESLLTQEQIEIHRSLMNILNF